MIPKFCLRLYAFNKQIADKRVQSFHATLKLFVFLKYLSLFQFTYLQTSACIPYV